MGDGPGRSLTAARSATSPAIWAVTGTPSWTPSCVFGEPLIDDPDRIGAVTAIGLDETLFARIGMFRTQLWSTQIVDVRRGQLLDVVEGRTAEEPCRWLAAQPDPWRDQIRWATLDLSASYRTVYDTMLPDAVQVADPFHVVRLANVALDECRRRVQNDTLGPPGPQARSPLPGPTAAHHRPRTALR